ncbi:hypothetical protein GOP47_0022083 [Adiantum capillus-veneris]|uniref:Uncharacterized protein n=1 Tax=Adiantum capillus-veneris TaxID=13818 RepID=A0A9D4Z8G6_ADICA|nr:hypothetical protein GOP47_0022083 [Adiantum capillus-veneris]
MNATSTIKIHLVLVQLVDDNASLVMHPKLATLAVGIPSLPLLCNDCFGITKAYHPDSCNFCACLQVALLPWTLDGNKRCSRDLSSIMNALSLAPGLRRSPGGHMHYEKRSLEDLPTSSRSRVAG